MKKKNTAAFLADAKIICDNSRLCGSRGLCCEKNVLGTSHPEYKPGKFPRFVEIKKSSYEKQDSTNSPPNVPVSKILDMPPTLFADSSWGGDP